MTHLLQTTIKMVFRPRETAKQLIEENNVSLAYWYFLITVILNFLFLISFGKSQMPQILKTDNVWLATIYALGTSIGIWGLGLLLPSFFINLVSKLFKVKSSYKDTLKCMAWTIAPLLLIIGPIAIFYGISNYAIQTELFIPNIEIWNNVLILLQSISGIAILLKVVVQIVFFSEVYQISILKTIILHVVSLVFYIAIRVFGILVF